MPGKAGEAHASSTPTGGLGPRASPWSACGEGADRDDWQRGRRGVREGRARRPGRRASAAWRCPTASAPTMRPALHRGRLASATTGSTASRSPRTTTAPSRIATLTVTGARRSAPAQLARDRTVMARPSRRARPGATRPANHLDPEHAGRATRRRWPTATPGLTCTVLGVRALSSSSAGALLAVGQGSHGAPVHDRAALAAGPRRPAAARCSGSWARPSRSTRGGISIKPSAGMEDMKMDMSGGAIAIESIAAIAAARACRSRCSP